MGRLWPPLLWIGVSIGSLFVLRGGSGEWRPGLLAAGLVLILGVLLTGLWMALSPRQPGPRRPGFYWAVAGGVALYLALAAGAALAGVEYAVAAVLAGAIPLAALALLIATIRRATEEDEGELRDASADADADPFPRVGLDTETALGDTRERSDAR
jgi:hypothetical protein